MLPVFTTKTRKQQCLDDVPSSMAKRQRIDEIFLESEKGERALDNKEVAYHKIPEKERAAYQAAEAKEWNSWLEYDAVTADSVRKKLRRFW